MVNLKIQKITSLGLCFIASLILINLKETRILNNDSILEAAAVMGYSGLGCSILFVAYKFIDWLIPANIEAEIFEKQNLAAAIFKGLLLIAITIIIAVVIATP